MKTPRLLPILLAALPCAPSLPAQERAPALPLALTALAAPGAPAGEDAMAEQAPDTTAPPVPVVPRRKPLPEDDGSRVTVLGYHDFTSDPAEKETAMRISTAKFRQQMEAIKALRLPVIGMDDFLAWKRGEKKLPPRSVLITIDDGWKTVYTEAFPVLREMGFPFTLYLYTDYLNIDGRSLSHEMVEEMKRHGCTVGCHSVSHPFPSKVKRHRRMSPEAYDKFLRKELGESKTFLEMKYGAPVTTYAYPGGFYTEEMFPLAREFGYQCLFTVYPGKVRRDSPDHILPRHIILGNHDRSFELATAFRSANGSGPIAGAVISEVNHPVTPRPGALTSSRLPRITADLSKAGDIDPSTLVMRVSGFGKVPLTYHPATGQATWKATRRLRQPTCTVSLQWREKGASAHQKPMRWSFQIDREAAYQPGAMN